MDPPHMMAHQTTTPRPLPHKGWVKSTHWISTMCFLVLAFTGWVILMSHPRLYWGETGNDLTPALFELPISRNHQHGGWQNRVSFFPDPASPRSASRSYDIFNNNSWGRSLHFLAAWCLVLTGVVYLLAGALTGHLRRHLLPRSNELTLEVFRRDWLHHWQGRIPAPTGGPHYGLLQKCAYCVVIFLLLPLMALTGLTMSPAITAGYPFLLTLFGGFQSARTLHFLASALLVVFVILHVGMVIRSGVREHLRAMTFGHYDES